MYPTSQRPGFLGRLEIFAYFAPILLGVFLVSGFLIEPQYLIWADRDLIRAYNFTEELPVRGAELNGTFFARTPGGALYSLLALFMVFSKDPFVINGLLIGFTLVGAVALYLAGRNAWGHIAGIAAAGLWLTEPLVVGTGFRIWNPAFGVPISAMCYLTMVTYLKGSDRALPWMGLLLGVAAQMHISYLAMLIALSASVACVRFPKLRLWFWFGITFLLTYIPYLVAEAHNGFNNTGLILLGENISNQAYTAIKYKSLEFFLHNIASPFGSSFGNASTLKLAGGILVIILILVRAVIALSKALTARRKNTPLSDSERIVLGLTVTVLVGVALIAVGRGLGPQPRYHVFLAPAVALLLASAVVSGREYMLNKACYRSAFSRILLAIFVIGINGASISVAAGIFKSRVINSHPSNLAIYSSLMQKILEITGYSQDDINRRILVINDDGKAKNLETNYLALIASEKTRVRQNIKKPGCLAVIESIEPTAVEKSFSRYMSTVPIRPTAVKLVGKTGPYTLISYELELDNCYKSLGNSYVQSHEEHLSKQHCDHAKADGLVWREREGNGQKFVVRDTFKDVRICFLIDFQRQGKRLVGTIHSWHARTYIGYPTEEWSFSDLSLVFIKEGHEIRRPLIKFPLGHREHTRTPWAYVVEAPLSAQYELNVDYTLEYSVDPDQKHRARHKVDDQLKIGH